MTYLEYFNEMKKCYENLDFKVIENIEKAILHAIANGNNIYVIGNGGNAATASHWVVDFSKGLENTISPRVNIYNLSDNIPIVTAYANDMSYEDIYFLQLKNKIKEDDILLVLSASGNSPNLVKAIKYANQCKACCISIVGDFNAKVLEYSNIKLIIKSKHYGIIEDIQLSLNHQIVQSIRGDEIKDE